MELFPLRISKGTRGSYQDDSPSVLLYFFCLQVHIVTRHVLVLGHRAEEKGQVVHGPSAAKVCPEQVSSLAASDMFRGKKGFCLSKGNQASDECNLEFAFSCTLVHMPFHYLTTHCRPRL